MTRPPRAAAVPLRSAARGVGRSRALGALGLLGAAALIALAAPQFINALHLAASEPLLMRVVHAEPRDPALAGLARHHVAVAESWFDNTAARLADAQLSLARARGADFEGPEAERALGRAIASVGGALRLAPGEPRAWALLAQLRYLRDPDDPAISAIVARAIDAAPGDQRFIRMRVDIGLRVWDMAAPPARRSIAHDTRLLAMADPPSFVALVRGAGTINSVREALADDPPLRQRIEAMFLQSPP